MKAVLKGSHYSVTVPIDELLMFAKQWPCHNLDLDAEYVFECDARNGDLVEIGKFVDGGYVSTDDAEDGPALLALSEEAGEFGARDLNLTDVLAIRYGEPSGPRM